MMNRILFSSLFLVFFNLLPAQKGMAVYTVETKNTMMIFSGEKDGKFLFQYFGQNLDAPAEIMKSSAGMNEEAYTTFGINCTLSEALRVTHCDGNMSLDLYLDKVDEMVEADGSRRMEILLYDRVYPFQVKLCYQAYPDVDVIKTWTEISHREKKAVTLNKYASVFLPIDAFDPWLTHFHGDWGDEFNMTEEKLTRGIKEIKNREGVRNARTDNPAFMLSLNGPSTENKGEVIGGALVYTGNYKLSFNYEIKNDLNVVAGINEEASSYFLDPKEVFTTAPMVLSYSAEGKGQVSRNFHRWARNYQLIDGNVERKILLNSWEGVYFDVSEEKMIGMIDDIADMGGEMFVMDDGWFGDKYPRNNARQGLGDWVVDTRKLPNGLDPLVKRAEEKDIVFGIWLEPEMIDDPSELYDAHPEWVVQQPNREIVRGRGQAQMLLDLSNPEVQDYVYGIIHNLLVENPRIGYIKWDANHFVSNMGSLYLEDDEQSHFYIAYHRGLIKTLERIRKDHPDIIMQACASGGGRVNFAYMPYFQEFWTSDLTDALSRIYIQWGTSYFYPAIVQAAHVSASPNHQSGRMLPLKFRTDVAMMGRFGLEMQPKDLDENEVVFTRNAIETYKSIRPVVQFGDQYRLISPYSEYGMASLIYVTEDKSRAVLFIFNLENNFRAPYPSIQLDGLDPERNYRLTEINREENARRQFGAENRVLSGDVLMKAGFQANMRNPFESRVIELVAED